MFDLYGIPYVTNFGPDFATSSAVRLPDYTAPEKLMRTEGATIKQREAELLVPAEHWGSPLSRSAQQATARQHLRAQAGFDTVVCAKVDYGHTTVLLFIHADGFWAEKPVDQSIEN